MLVWQPKMSENFVGPKAKIAQNKKQREGGRNSKNHQKIESPIEAIGSLRAKNTTAHITSSRHDLTVSIQSMQAIEMKIAFVMGYATQCIAKIPLI